MSEQKSGLNEKRSNPDLRRLYDAIERSRQECQEQHAESQKTLHGIVTNQAAFSTRIDGVDKSLNRIGEKVDKTAERVAATESTVTSLKKQNGEQYERISSIEGDVKVLAGKGNNIESELKNLADNTEPVVGVSFIHSDNFRWLVGGLIAVLVIILMAWGLLTPDDLKDINSSGIGAE
jgi:chromosome segregation ATPase